MSVDTIVAALQSLRPGAEWSLTGDSYDGLEWLDETQEKPTAAEIEAFVQPAPVEPTAQEKLEAAGLTVAELKKLLGLK